MVSAKLISIALVVVGVVIIILTGISFPVSKHFLDEKIRKETVLINGTDFYNSWQRPDVPIYFQIYFFDLMNHDEYLQGNTIPWFEQRGPYTYREHREKIDVVFHDNGTVSYRQVTTYDFEEEKSAGPESDQVTTINVFLMSIIEWCNTHDSRLIHFLVKWLLPLIADESVVITKSVGELAWGYTDPLLKKLHSYAPVFFPTDKVGYFLDKNNTAGKPYTIHTGTEDHAKLGVITIYNGNSSVPYWSTPYANMINGSDGTIFSPEMVSSKQPLQFFVEDICRSMIGTFTDVRVLPDGLTTHRYTAPPSVLANASTNPDNAGFCTPPGNCLGAGMLNLSSCQVVFGLNVPIVASLPHFYEAEPHYQQSVAGLDPNQPDLETELLLEPHTALLLSAKKRLQINVFVRPSNLSPKSQKLTDLIFPVLWVNESTTIDSPNVHKLNSKLLDPMFALFVVQMVLFGIGALCIIIGVIVFSLWAHRTSTTDEEDEEDTQPIISHEENHEPASETS